MQHFKNRSPPPVQYHRSTIQIFGSQRLVGSMLSMFLKEWKQDRSENLCLLKTCTSLEIGQLAVDCPKCGPQRVLLLYNVDIESC
jgi:hypothetical protein